MLGGNHSRVSHCFGAAFLTALAIFLCIEAPHPAAAQVHGIPPSVTSIQNHLPPYLPNIPASVTSLGPRGYVGPPAFPVYPNRRGPYGGRNYRTGYGYGYGTGAWVVPYYIPSYDTSGYDSGGGGPYLYSGPPQEQTLHVVVDLAPPRPALPEEDLQASPAAATEPPHQSEVAPLDATVLVFRDGHEQQVTNYAVMGQTLYVFDSHKQKISLSDLDVPATVKANDDRGVDFVLPDLGHS